MSKKDPYIAILDFYHEKLPEPLSFQEVCEHLYEKGYITDAEISFISGKSGILDHETRKELRTRKNLFHTLYVQSGTTIINNNDGWRLMSLESYFQRLEYIELQESRKTSKWAVTLSILAIIISCFSAYFAWESLQKPLNINPSQIKELIGAIRSAK